jgi:hypothetical protein
MQSNSLYELGMTKKDPLKMQLTKKHADKMHGGVAVRKEVDKLNGLTSVFSSL